jgi:hypothetical protein
MKWISVKDRLPEKYKKVIVTNGKQVCLHYKQSGWNFKGSEGDDLFPLSCEQSESWYCGIEEGDVTHWMPLPDTPNEKL